MSKKDINKLIGDGWFERNIGNLEHTFNSYPSSILVKWLQKQDLKPTGKILELGCGPGFNLDFLTTSLNITGFGIDPSELSVSYANSHFPNLNISLGTADDLSQFEDASFEFIHLGFFMYFIDDNCVKKIVSECNRVLKVNGMLSILDFDVRVPETKIDHHEKSVMIFKRDQAIAFQENFVLLNKRTFTSLKESKINLNEDRTSLQLLFKEN